MSQSIRHNMTRNGLILGLFALVSTGLIALTFFGTKDQIAHQQKQKLQSILNQVIDPNRYNNTLYLDCVDRVAPDFLGSKKAQRIYRATQDGKPVALAVETTAPDGYNGNIHLVVGLTLISEQEVEISGVRVLSHKETPGLGDKIELRIHDWILSFNGKPYSDALEKIWAVKKDGGQFDQFTGATITPRAVVKAVKRSAEYYLQQQDTLFRETNACALASQAPSEETTP